MTGQAYGNPTLDTNATVPAAATLTIPAGASLTIASGTTLTLARESSTSYSTLINNGAIYVKGEAVFHYSTEDEKAPDYGICLLYTSTIVNMEQIEQMGTGSCMLRDGTRLDFPRRERGAIRAAYDSYLFSRLCGRQGFDGEVGP